ncbi:MAG: Transglutaminase-like superfamily protein [Phycisphaerales bacterium]|nr:Transglutaminase-like superfamily protein [Phycisphaerales bacterium]
MSAVAGTTAAVTAVVPGRAAAAVAVAAPEQEPTGASLAWTSDDPVVVEARAMIKAGRLSDAEKLLGRDDPSASPAAKAARAETVEIIARTRYDYPVGSDALLAQLRRRVPALTAAQLDQWRKDGGVQWRTIDGKVAYFRREPKNMARFCEPYQVLLAGRDRGGPGPTEAAGGWTLAAHLKRVVDDAERAGRPDVLPVKTTVKFSLTVPADAPGMKPGALVRAWLPFPQEYGKRQYGVRLISASPSDPQVAPAAVGEHPLAGSPHRSAYFEQRVADPAKPVVFREAYEFTSQAYCPVLDEAKAQPLPASYADGNLGERLPHIAFTPELKRTVDQIVGTQTNPLARARAIFRWIDANVAYHAEEAYSVLPSFSEACLGRRRGDCGIKGTLFITMCRAAGVPARWQSGWETKPGDWDMHDWAEFYVAPWGWLPADVTAGVQKSDDPRIRDFYCGHQDSYRLIVNRDYGAPLVPPKASMRSDTADFQSGEVEVDGRNLYVDKWDYAIDFAWDAKP